MEAIMAPVAAQDMFHIRISCRCGEKNVAEVPKQLARMVNIHVCSKCSRMFGIQRQEDSSWKIQSIEVEAGVAISPEMIKRIVQKGLKEALKSVADTADPPKDEEKPEKKDWTN